MMESVVRIGVGKLGMGIGFWRGGMGVGGH